MTTTPIADSAELVMRLLEAKRDDLRAQADAITDQMLCIGRMAARYPQDRIISTRATQEPLCRGIANFLGIPKTSGGRFTFTFRGLDFIYREPGSQGVGASEILSINNADRLHICGFDDPTHDEIALLLCGGRHGILSEARAAIAAQGGAE